MSDRRLRETCGTYARYQWGPCRCPACTDAYRLYRKRLREGRHTPIATCRVSPIGTQRRIQALQCMGYSLRDLSLRAGKSPNYFSKWSTPRYGMVDMEVAKLVSKLYEQLHMTPGPSPYAGVRARRRGLAPPLAWDEDQIDNPNAGPNMPRRHVAYDEVVVVRWMGGERNLAPTMAERKEIIRRSQAAGIDVQQVADDLGLTYSPVARAYRALRLERRSIRPVPASTQVGARARRRSRSHYQAKWVNH